MEPTLFTGLGWPETSWVQSIAYASIAIFFLCLASMLVLERKLDAKNIYYNHLAWIRGFAYFAACFFVSSITGVLEALLAIGLPDMGAKSTSWHITLDIWIIVVLVGYLGVWRKGTITLDRKYSFMALPFGILWGLSEGQLFLAFWSLAEMTGLSVLWVAVLTYVLVSIFNSGLHILFWDTYVAPAHNITEWNMKKVALAHNPNLIIGLVFLALFNEPLVFLLVQTLALTLCTNIMYFPPFWQTETHGKPVVKGGNIDQKDLITE